MVRVRRILRHVQVEQAKLRRCCHHDRSHVIRRGENCLVVRSDNLRGARNYCGKCARPILKLAWLELKAMAQAFAEIATDRSVKDPETSCKARGRKIGREDKMQVKEEKLGS